MLGDDAVEVAETAAVAEAMVVSVATAPGAAAPAAAGGRACNATKMAAQIYCNIPPTSPCMPTAAAHLRAENSRQQADPSPPPPTRQMRHIEHLGHIKQRGYSPTLDVHLPHHVVVQPRWRGREASGCRKPSLRRLQGFRRPCRRGGWGVGQEY